MQQHYQVLNLHNIIKTQDAKISELRHELRIANEREEQRYGQLTKQSKIQHDQKDKVIQFLKVELTKARTQSKEQKELERGKNEELKMKQEKQVLNYKKKLIELEGKLKREENESQLKIEELININQKLSEEVQNQEQNKTFLMSQVSKLNYFYKNSMFEIPKRKQTLLWVEKFTQYLQQAQKQEDKTLSEVNRFVKGEVQTLRTQFANIIKDVHKNEHQTKNLKDKSTLQLKDILEKLKFSLNQSLKENENYWIKIVKQERQSQKTLEINKLRQQLSQEKRKNQAEVDKLKNQLRIQENEKKTLIMGFQELKNLNQSKEHSYRDEIKYLKQSIEELLQSAELRDKEFEEEIKAMTQQIQSISQRYYENIEFPINKVNQQFNEEVQRVKTQLTKLNQNSTLKNSLQKSSYLMEEYMKMKSRNSDQKQILTYIQTSNQLMEKIQKQLIKKKVQKNSDIQSENQIKYIEMREKYNKSQYEIILTKKHLQKLQQYTNNLEKKTTKFYSAKKLQELQSENEALKKSIEQMKQSHLQDLSALKSRYMSAVDDPEYHQMMHSVIHQLRQTNQYLYEYVREDEEHFQKIQRSLSIVNGFFMKPMQSFETFMKSLSQLQSQSRLQFTGRETTTQRTGKSINREGINNYKSILLKRNQINHSTQKLVLDLIKILRENQKQSKIREIQKKIQLQQTPKKKDKLVQKKIKQAQAQRIKDRQENVNKIEAMMKNMQLLQAKVHKHPSLMKNLEKFQQQFQRRLSQMIDKTHLKIDKSSVRQIKEEVIKDLRSKINEVNVQNQGLRKELSLMISVQGKKN